MDLYKSIKNNLNEADEVLKQGMWGDKPIELIRLDGGNFTNAIYIYSKYNHTSQDDALFFKSEDDATKEFDRLDSLDVKDFTYEDKKAFAESIPLEPLWNKINDFVGSKLTFEHSFKDDKYYNSVRLAFKSNDITDLCGVFSKILDSCVIDEFGSFVGPNTDGTSLCLSVQVHLSYQHKDGGSNGMKLFRAYYEDGNWDFDF